MAQERKYRDTDKNLYSIPKSLTINDVIYTRYIGSLTSEYIFTLSVRTCDEGRFFYLMGNALDNPAEVKITTDFGISNDFRVYYVNAYRGDTSFKYVTINDETIASLGSVSEFGAIFGIAVRMN